MPDIRLHGRGGQGILAAGEIIARAAWHHGWQSRFFPSFGSERSGSPVAAFVRLQKKEILTREQISRPDILVVHDNSLLLEPSIAAGISTKTKVVINSADTEESIQNILKGQKIGLTRGQIFLFDADALTQSSGLARGSNVAIAAWTGRKILDFSYRELEEAIKETFRDKNKDIIDSNLLIAKAIFKL